MTCLWQILLGFVVGAFIASIGYHRERKFEAFSRVAWLRSVTVASVCGLVIFMWNVLPNLTFTSLILTGCFIACFERLTLETYKTYVKADYRPHVVCAVCHCNVHKIHGQYVRPENKITRLEKVFGAK